MNRKTPIRVVGYVRVSTEEQANSGLSLSHQRTRITAFAQASDFELLEVIEEPGKSAKNLKRPGLQRALELLEGGGADALVVLSLDRLTRSVKDLGYLVEFFDRTKTALVSVQDSINTLTAAGRLVLNVLGSIAQWEREAIAERTSAAMAVKIRRGEKTGGTIPYGFDVDEAGKLFPNTEEQEGLRLMRRWRKKGFSFLKIGILLQKRGFSPKKAGKWHPQVVKQVLNLQARGVLCSPSKKNEQTTGPQI
jgi:DNA invertase Pin-like site-specific DNA recombinase